MARVALPDAMIREGIERDARAGRGALAALAAEGVALARAPDSRPNRAVLVAHSPWRALRDAARDYDVLVCGTRGEGPVGRVLLGSTASSLVHHAEPRARGSGGRPRSAAPCFAGFDGSDGARDALRFAAEHLAPALHHCPRLAFAGAPHAARARAGGSGVDMFDEYARRSTRSGARWPRRRRRRRRRLRSRTRLDRRAARARVGPRRLADAAPTARGGERRRRAGRLARPRRGGVDRSRLRGLRARARRGAARPRRRG